MKNNTLTYIILTALILCGCSEQDDIQGGSQETKTTTVTISASREVTSSTKIEYEDNNPDGLIVKWKSDRSDKIGVFATNGNTSNAEFGVDGELLKDGKIANFTGNIEITDPNSAITVYAYYPYLASESDKGALTIDLSSQHQNGTGETDHLQALDFMVSTPFTYNKAVDMQANNIPLSFNPMLAIMSFEITNTSASTIEVNSIRLESLGKETPFYTCGKIDITDKAAPITHEGYDATNGVELLTTNGTIQGGDKGRFNMIIFPLTDQVPTQLKVIVRTDCGNYTQTKATPIGGFLRGKRYIMVVDNMVGTVAATGVTINKKATSLSFGATETLTATVVPANATNKNVVWSSDNTDVATVDASGKVVAVDLGTANITATTEDGGFKSSCQVSVINSTGRTIIRNKTAFITALENGGKYILVGNIPDALGVVSNDVDLDLNGYTIEGRSVYGLINVSGSKTLTICDNSPRKTGVIRNNINGNSSDEYTCCAIELTGNYSELKILSGTIISSETNAIYSKYSTKTTIEGGRIEGRIKMQAAGTVIINNGEIVGGVDLYGGLSSGSHLILNNGKISTYNKENTYKHSSPSVHCNNTNSSVTINGGEIVCNSESDLSACALYMGRNITLTINGGTISATGGYTNTIDAGGLVESDRVDIIINGGNVIAKGTSERATVCGLVTRSSRGSTTLFTINGGSINADHPNGIGIININQESTIKAGTIKGGNIVVSGTFPRVATGSSILKGGFLEKTVVIGPSN